MGSHAEILQHRFVPSYKPLNQPYSRMSECNYNNFCSKYGYYSPSRTRQRTHYNPPKANNGSNWKSNRDGDGIPPDGLEAKAAAAVTDQKKTVEKGGGEGGGKDDKNNNSNKDSWKLKYAKIVKRRNTIAEVAASPEAASAELTPTPPSEPRRLQERRLTSEKAQKLVSKREKSRCKSVEPFSFDYNGRVTRSKSPHVGLWGPLGDNFRERVATPTAAPLVKRRKSGEVKLPPPPHIDVLAVERDAEVEESEPQMITLGDYKKAMKKKEKVKRRESCAEQMERLFGETEMEEKLKRSKGTENKNGEKTKEAEANKKIASKTTANLPAKSKNSDDAPRKNKATSESTTKNKSTPSKSTKSKSEKTKHADASKKPSQHHKKPEEAKRKSAHEGGRSPKKKRLLLEEDLDALFPTPSAADSNTITLNGDSKTVLLTDRKSFSVNEASTSTLSFEETSNFETERPEEVRAETSQTEPLATASVALPPPIKTNEEVDDSASIKTEVIELPPPKEQEAPPTALPQKAPPTALPATRLRITNESFVVNLAPIVLAGIIDRHFYRCVTSAFMRNFPSAHAQEELDPYREAQKKKLTKAAQRLYSSLTLIEDVTDFVVDNMLRGIGEQLNAQLIEMRISANVGVIFDVLYGIMSVMPDRYATPFMGRFVEQMKNWRICQMNARAAAAQNQPIQPQPQTAQAQPPAPPPPPAQASPQQIRVRPPEYLSEQHNARFLSTVVNEISSPPIVSNSHVNPPPSVVNPQQTLRQMNNVSSPLQTQQPMNIRQQQQQQQLLIAPNVSPFSPEQRQRALPHELLRESPSFARLLPQQQQQQQQNVPVPVMVNQNQYLARQQQALPQYYNSMRVQENNVNQLLQQQLLANYTQFARNIPIRQENPQIFMSQMRAMVNSSQSVQKPQTNSVLSNNPQSSVNLQQTYLNYVQPNQSDRQQHQRITTEAHQRSANQKKAPPSYQAATSRSLEYAQQQRQQQQQGTIIVQQQQQSSLLRKQQPRTKQNKTPREEISSTTDGAVVPRIAGTPEPLNAVADASRPIRIMDQQISKHVAIPTDQLRSLLESSAKPAPSVSSSSPMTEQVTVAAVTAKTPENNGEAKQREQQSAEVAIKLEEDVVEVAADVETKEIVHMVDLTGSDDEYFSSHLDSLFADVQSTVKIEETSEENTQEEQLAGSSERASKEPEIIHPDVHNKLCLCGKLAVNICACKIVVYCSRDCQVEDWPNHRENCREACHK